MKIIKKPLQKEDAEYYSDFSGDRFYNDIPEVELKLSFNYGSPFDGSDIDIHLSHKESLEIMNLIKSKISDKTKEKLSEYLKKAEDDYESSMQFREWDYCDRLGSNMDLYNFFINNGQEQED